MKMIFTRKIIRFYHTSRQMFAAESKSSLASLRKKTGYSIANCKKALQLHNDDMIAAEKWLQEQAQTLGWKKATKLEGRKTSQGLIGLVVKDSCAAMVEMNCETDFVAKNKEFKNMVDIAANSCVNYTKQNYTSNAPIIKVCFSSEQLRDLPAENGRKLSDVLALMIGSVGENANFKRAFCFKAGHGICLAGYTHPSGDEMSNTQLGKFGGILAYKQITPKEIDLKQVGKEICQHIVGMNPQTLGSLEEFPEENNDEEPKEKNEDEQRLLYQEFLLDETIKVKDFLDMNGIEIVDFKRFQCGENLMESGDQPLEFVETCQ